MSILFLINLAASLFMCGLIWLVQLVHYPLFHRLEKTDYPAHQAFHRTRISWIVLPVMLAELGTSAWLVWGPFPLAAWHAAGLSLVIAAWLSTFFLQVPQHEIIASGYEKKAVQKLISSNWIRTILWSTKSILSLITLWLWLGML